MKLKALVPEFIVSNLDKSISFYEDALHFKLEITAPDVAPFTWAQLQLGDFRIMMQDHYETKREISDFPSILGSTVLFVLKYDDLEVAKAMYTELQRKGIQTFIEYRETDYGTVEFGIVDPDGYRIIISAE